MESVLAQSFIYLLAAVVAVPLANRLGLGSVLGYLIAGVVIGPILGLVGAETQDLQHFAEFGVVMMLFLIGLEMEPRVLWAMRLRLLGLGGLQIALSTALIALVAMALGQAWTVALAIGLTFALSSTAIVMQTLREKGLIRTDGGRASFSVLLAQDIAVIPMLALIPLLAAPELMGADWGGVSDIRFAASTGGSLLEGQPGWVVTLALLASVGAIVGGGHFLTRPMFRFLSHARLPEIFTAAALLLVVAIALLMTVVGLSPALGTFLAGVVLANSEYRHELEADIEPFKGLLLGLFFITVGAGIDFQILAGSFVQVVGLTLGLMLAKFMVLFALAKVFGLRGAAAWLFALALSQAGEFGFVLLSFTTQNDVIPVALGQTLQLIVALSMLLTPLLFILYDRVIAARVDTEALPDDDIDEAGPVIIAGLGRFGQVVNRMLLSHGHKTVVLDYHNGVIEGLRRFGVKAFFGDPSRPDLLLAAGIRDARVLVIAMDDTDKAVHMVEYVSREHPHVHIVARARDREHVYRLYAAGARDIVRETFDSSVRAGRYTLRALGLHPYEAERAARAYVRQDRADLAELAQLWDPDVPVFENEAYAARAREINRRVNAAMMGEGLAARDGWDRAWAPPPQGGTVARDPAAATETDPDGDGPG
ncbi:potassium transporter [Halovulum dunhuangense]|uniref:Potassium transporter n=1 Tax=Halovulum dunhuangense TaxID=1505036 RepID=A0A849L4R3_9RHOB|nr:monovalent cation:proton antiporter-2 (CPA2) family protein [Halovulum dunhuangense]NNU81428.1 potassium transporter [Halovulum dunhuangense]